MRRRIARTLLLDDRDGNDDLLQHGAVGVTS